MPAPRAENTSRPRRITANHAESRLLRPVGASHKAQPHGVVELQFVKSKSDGVNIYSQRDGDGSFVFLARDTASPYVDNRPLVTAGKPETRKYKAIYVQNDAEIGQPSDEVVVTCQT